MNSALTIISVNRKRNKVQVKWHSDNHIQWIKTSELANPSIINDFQDPEG